jgi:SulP family sulfate permease
MTDRLTEAVAGWFQGFDPPRPVWWGAVDGDSLRRDLVAGLTVGVVLVPQSMAYATLGGLPPLYGLYASLIPLLVYPFFGTARQLAVGVVALDMLVLGAGLGGMAEPGSERYVQLAILLAALLGVVQLAMAALRLGFLADLLSRPVVVGFTSAAAVVIAASQVGPLLGIELPRSQYVWEIAVEAVPRMEAVHAPTALLGAGAVALILVLRRWVPAVPASLVAVVGAMALTAALGLADAGVEVTGAVPPGLPSPGLPEVSAADLETLFPLAITLALLQLMSVTSLARALAARHDYTVRPNREILGLGLANLVGSIFRSVPVSASFSRSAVAEESRAVTPLHNVVAASVVALALLVLTPLFAFLPRTVLAAIIIVGASGLVAPGDFVQLWRTHRQDGVVALVTAGATLVFGIQEGIVVGVSAAALAVLRRLSRPHIVELGLLPGTHFFRDRERFEGTRRIPGILVLRVDAAFSFFNATYFRDRIAARSRRSNGSTDMSGDDGSTDRLRALIIEGRGINSLDTTALDALEDLIGILDAMDIRLYFAGLKGPVRDVLERSSLGDRLATEVFHLSTHYAVRWVLERCDEEEGTGSEFLKRYDELSAGEGGEPAPGHGVPLT